LGKEKTMCAAILSTIGAGFDARAFLATSTLNKKAESTGKGRTEGIKLCNLSFSLPAEKVQSLTPFQSLSVLV
jgi:hypothetical protein